MNTAAQLRKAADILKEQLSQKRREISELENLWIEANRIAREAEGGWVGTVSFGEDT